MRSYRFTAASGGERDENEVRLDFNTAKVVGNVRYGQHFLFYQNMLKWLYVDYTDIVWVYRRLEDVKSRLCCGTAGFEVHSLMLVTKEKKRLGIPVGGREYAVEGLNIIGLRNPFADVGYTKEKEEKYLGCETETSV